MQACVLRHVLRFASIFDVRWSRVRFEQLRSRSIYIFGVSESDTWWAMPKRAESEAPDAM